MYLIDIETSRYVCFIITQFFDVGQQRIEKIRKISLADVQVFSLAGLV